ncbi:dienelactone hydrolase [Aquihabitans sp. G128]|uniref:alpha/beta hydrolase family protein n=1 Tax=Aquihabitans sp. G128 TaxID=2849779 RepID=UPI001C24D770|nr:alpha/beta family hydrolase [Aquihabitans sp. G128]QXC63144.1 dienelactone hydrolase [Aquihabitans sp. G128]
MRPKPGRPEGLLLTPGAGSGRDHHTLVALDEAVAPLPVARVDFPYRKEGRKAPDRAPKLIASLVADAEAFAASTPLAPEGLVLGGRSMGGRICSMAVAEGLPAAGLVLLSYPLHPPGKPEKLRIDHLPDLHVPCLFISGTRDAFGSPAELEEHTAAIGGPVTHHWLEGKAHDVKGADDEICAVVVAWLADLPARPPTRR